MMIGTTILARGDLDDVMYIVAVLVLAAVGAIVEKLKRRMSGGDEERRVGPPLPPRTAERPVRPAAPPAHPAAPTMRRPPPLAPPVRPAAPPARPVEGPVWRRPMAPPRPPAAPRPVAMPPPRPPAPARPGRPEPATPVLVAGPEEPTVGRVVPREVGARIQKLKVVKEVPGGRPAQSLAQSAPAPAPPTPVGGRWFGPLSLADIRRAVVFNELLGSPLALREPDWLDRY